MMAVAAVGSGENATRVIASCAAALQPAAIHKQIDTQTQTDTQTHTDTHAHTHTRTHAHTHTRTHAR